MQFPKLGGVYAVSEVGRDFMRFPRWGGVLCSFRGREGFYAVSKVGRGFMQFPR